jgi:hypothetical protein
MLKVVVRGQALQGQDDGKLGVTLDPLGVTVDTGYAFPLVGINQIRHCAAPPSTALHRREKGISERNACQRLGEAL